MGHKQQKQYILDTNVLMHDPDALLKFGRHIVAIPLKVSEELDNHKSGVLEKNRNTRQAIRNLDGLMQNYNGAANHEGLVAQIQLDGLCELTEKYGATGQLYLQTEEARKIELPFVFDDDKYDNSILRYALAEKDRRGNGRGGGPRPVILVTKDISLRNKARMLGIEVQDYRNEAVSLEDIDVLATTGMQHLPEGFWSEVQFAESQQDSRYGSVTTFEHELVGSWYPNQGLVIGEEFESGKLYRVLETSGTRATVLQIPDWQRQRREAFGIHPRNMHQAYAMHLCLDPHLPVVFLNGIAGSGKTLIALVCGLEQIFNERIYTRMIATRATVPSGEDIGFLPGTEAEKMQPWMGAVTDNLEVITHEWEDDKCADGLHATGMKGASMEMLRSRIDLKSTSFMRGRTLFKRYIILDEGQNLTPKDMRTLISRVGFGSKIVVLGNVKQIDAKYLTETDNGLSVWANRFMPSPLGAHVILQGSERSAVADFVERF
ncbi:MAG: PhoH family protein [Candidatus Kaiserbacteria bacterium]|nr:PhoH family protein [Candidatus Kaiserbacteria bacterium]MCB9816412.1 PhoH family protein [Candidatus Nomurabacteria bacterium]